MSKCPQCGAPPRVIHAGGVHYECHSQVEYGYSPSTSRICDYAAGLLERAERAEAERDELRAMTSTKSPYDRINKAEAALRRINDKAAHDHGHTANPRTTVEVLWRIAREALEAGDE